MIISSGFQGDPNRPRLVVLMWVQESQEPGAAEPSSDKGKSLCHCSVTQSCLTAAPWTAALLASLSFTVSSSLLKLMSIESVMPSNHLILCRPLLLLPSIFPSIRVFSNESALRIRWPEVLEVEVRLQHQSFQGIFRVDFL